MTDDKGAGDGVTIHAHSKYVECEECAFNRGYAAGRKAERERCLEIARGFSSCEGIAQKIAKEIMEAQDGE